MGCCLPASAAPRASIVIGLSAGEVQAARLQACAQTLHTGFLARGFPAETITVLGASGERVRRETLLAALQPPSLAAPASDAETWIVLLGSANDRSGEPSFQISGPRLGASELAAVVKRLPGRTYVIVATSASGGFLPPLLALPNVEAVAASAATGEVNEPRFAAAWAESLVASPQDSFNELALSAAQRVAEFYQGADLAQGEHAQRLDHASGSIIAVPTNVAEAVAPPPPAPTAVASHAPAKPVPSRGVDALEIPRAGGDTETEHRPATAETLALLTAARAGLKDDGPAAVFLRVETDLTINRDLSANERHRIRAYLRTGEALDDLGTLLLPSSPPDYLSRLEGVRVITPNGAQVLVNPRALDRRLAEDRREADAARSQKRSAGPTAPAFLPLPAVTAGCIVEAAWSVERRASTELPEFSREWLLAQPYPIREQHLRVVTPDEARWRTFAPHLPAATVVVAEGRRSSTWTLANLPACTPRAGDAPLRSTAPWVGVSSLPDWDSLVSWYRRITYGSELTGPAVAALATELGQKHPDRAGRLRAAYEQVAALRYVAVELGVGAIRARTPEQVWTQRYGDCKDKANLLVAVLRQLGITAEFALVNRGDVTFTDWPAWQFNHAVARVPSDPAAGQPQDLWLDTTDRLVPYGIVAPGDLGCQALAFNAQGTGAFHAITADQEPKSEWHESFDVDRARVAGLTLRVWAQGSAEVALRRMFAAMPAGVRAERVQALLGWRGGPVQRVRAGDPYDLSQPFAVTIELMGTIEDVRSKPPRLLVPGLEPYGARLAHRTQALFWDDGRTWTIYRGEGDVAQGFELPGRKPAPVPGEGPDPLPFFN